MVGIVVVNYREYGRTERFIREEIARSGERTLMFALIPEHITGKIVNEA